MQLLEFPAISDSAGSKRGAAAVFAGCGSGHPGVDVDPEWNPATWNRQADFAALSNMAVKIILSDRTFRIRVLQNSYRKKAAQGGEGPK
jgi:hypothetical protein